MAKPRTYKAVEHVVKLPRLYHWEMVAMTPPKTFRRKFEGLPESPQWTYCWIPHQSIEEWIEVVW